MSGIAGTVNPFEAISPQCVKIGIQSDSIRTRGPGGTGLFLSPHAALVHRGGNTYEPGNASKLTQLSIEGKSYVVTLNGYIYNYKELRSELEGMGACFEEGTCGELLLWGFNLWGEALFPKLNGMFAFALFIPDSKILYLVRDQLGAKPLYYAMSASSLLFSSTFQGITEHPQFRSSLGLEGMSELICLSPRYSPGSTPVKGIHQVRPGYFVRYGPEDMKAVRYWHIEEKEHGENLGQTLESVRNLVNDAARLRIQSGSPLCGLLSGGLYSSILTAIATQSANARLYPNLYNTWSVDFEKNSRYFHRQSPAGDTDTPWIRWMCRKAGTRHHYIILSPYDLAGALLETEEAWGFPGMPDQDCSLFLLCREIKKEFPIVLSGDCSDELFGGNVRGTEKFASGKKKLPWSVNIGEKISVFKNELIDAVKPYEFIEKCYEEALLEYPKFTSSRLKKDMEAQWFSLYWNLPCTLDKLDRMSMAFGLEARAPFCDYRLIEYLWNVPQEMKRLNGVERGLLREAFRGLIPSDILERKKGPFPHNPDPDYEMYIRTLLTDILMDPASPINYLLNLKTLEAMLRQPPDLNKRYTSRSQLYGWLIQLNHFMEQNGFTAL